CISVDPWFLVEVAPDLTRLIRAAREVNDSQPDFVVEWMERTLGRLEGRRVAVLGLAYKPDVDDLRESPAIEVALRLVQAGAQVRAFEPFKPEAQIPAVPTVTALADALQDAEILLLLVGHTRLRELNPEEVRTQTSARLVFDAVNGWDQTQWQKAGFQVWRLGVGRGDV
ncbi:UDP binding domain-containing protein, partial [Thermanaerothrix sp.]